MNEEAKIEQIGNAYPSERRENPSAGRIYSKEGLSPTLTGHSGGCLEPHIVSYTRSNDGKEISHHLKDEANTVHTATGSGGNTDQYVAEPRGCAMRGRGAENEQQLEFRKDDISSTLTTVQKDSLLAEHEPKVYGPTSEYRVRKLTERECFRLMDVSDEDIDKIQAAGISRTQQYKMAGNSIVVNCLYKIFSNMFITTEPESDGQLTLPL